MTPGHYFKYTREHKGISQSIAARGIIALPTLQDFEDDHIDIATSKLLLLLARIDVSLSEYADISGRVLGQQVENRTRLHDAFVHDNVTAVRRVFDRLRPHKMDPIAFLSMMMAAGLYHNMTGEVLASDHEIQELDASLSLVHWDEFTTDALRLTADFLPDNHLFLLAREIIAETDELRNWDFPLYSQCWTAVLTCLSVLVARRSSFVPTLMRQIDLAPVMEEQMLQNRYALIFIKALIDAQKNSTIEKRNRVEEIYRRLIPLRQIDLIKETKRLAKWCLNVDLPELVV